MTRQQLEHIIRASAGNANVRDVVIVGSQAILGAYPDAPEELTRSMEADVFPKDAPERSIVIDGAIGELSLFHSTFGYYAHGADERRRSCRSDGAIVWSRSTLREPMGAVGWCLDPHDLAVSKLAAGREKDVAFVRTMIQKKLVSPNMIRERLAATPQLQPAIAELALAQLDAMER